MEQELSLPAGMLRLSVSASTDCGRVRRINEDSFLASAPVFLVADGMGGHLHGDRASQAAVAAFERASRDTAPWTSERVIETVKAANDAVLDASNRGDSEAISGTTLAGIALVRSERAHHWMAFNVGDSRVYSWDGRHFEQVTVDHSAVQELLDRGEINSLDAVSHPDRNIVTRAIGVGDAVDPDVWLLPVTGQQLFVICSDGLTKELADDQVATILANRFSLPEGETVADRLVEAALAAGGRDNVTVIVVDSTLVGLHPEADDETNDRGISRDLEETRPRK